jgi:hypothetical protein
VAVPSWQPSCGPRLCFTKPGAPVLSSWSLSATAQLTVSHLPLNCHHTGDKPELLYPEALAELQAMGYNSTLQYVAAAAQAVLTHTGLLPHVNAGVMGRAELAQLREVSASQGLMLESVSERLLQPGGAHHACPDKVGVCYIRAQTLLGIRSRAAC